MNNVTTENERNKNKYTPLWVTTVLLCYVPFFLFVCVFILALIYCERHGGFITVPVIPPAIENAMTVTAMMAFGAMMFAFCVMIVAFIRRRIVIALLLVIASLLNFFVLPIYVFAPLLL